MGTPPPWFLLLKLSYTNRQFSLLYFVIHFFSYFTFQVLYTIFKNYANTSLIGKCFKCLICINFLHCKYLFILLVMSIHIVLIVYILDVWLCIKKLKTFVCMQDSSFICIIWVNFQLDDLIDSHYVIIKNLTQVSHCHLYIERQYQSLQQQKLIVYVVSIFSKHLMYM